VIWESNPGPPSIFDTEWVHVAHDISAYAGATLRVRFGFSIEEPLVATSSWNIDDVMISTATCNPD